MTVSDKNIFISDVENAIGEYLTGAHTKRVIQDINAQLIDYNLECIRTDYKPCDDDAIKAFLNAKEVEGKSPKTIKRYSYMLEKVFAAIGKPVSLVDADDLRKYLTDEKARGLSGRSLEGVRQILSSFFNWVWKEGHINRNPMGNIGAIKHTDKIRKPYSETELERIKSVCEKPRDLAIVHFLLVTGCRVNEACSMNIEDVNFDALECKVLGKGNKERVVYMTPVAAMILQDYLKTRTDADDALFIGQRGRLTPDGLRVVLKALEHRSGVDNVHPHRFRRTLATTLINRGMPIQDVAKILGHSNINTTMTYVYLDKVNVKHSYRQCIG